MTTIESDARHAGTAPFTFAGKRILLLSPDRWGSVRLSKHHYALALAERGSDVYYVEPPSVRGAPVAVRTADDAPGIRLVSYGTRIPLALRFKLRPAYDALLRPSMGALSRVAGGPFDVVWSFDGNTYTDLRWFDAPLRIYHPVDAVFGAHQPRLARSADVIISVAREILDSFDGTPTPRHLVQHGLGDEFASRARRRLAAPPGARARDGGVRVGYVGSLFKRQLDRDVMRTLITGHPEAEFHVWSPLSLRQSNVAGAESADVLEFVEWLKGRTNVRLRGLQPPAVLADQMEEMDLFVYPNDIRTDQNHGSNSHKLLEYLSTGRPVVASATTMYRDVDVLEMLPTTDNAGFAALFDRTLSRLDELTTPARQRERTEFALEHCYQRQIDRIEAIVGAQLGRGATAQ